MSNNVKVMSQKRADNYYEMLYRFSQVIKKLKLTYWLEGGTLIGAIREGALLSWDKDVDVSMLERDRKILWENKKLIKKYGLKPGYTDQIYRIDFKNVYMDIFSYEFKNGIYQEIHKFNRYRWPQSYYKASHLFPLKTAKFGPLIQPVPNKSEDFLKQAYGDWHIIPKMYRHLKVYKINSSNELKNKIKNNKIIIEENLSNTSKKCKSSKIYDYILCLLPLLIFSILLRKYKDKIIV